MKNSYDFTKNDIIIALRKAGLNFGNSLFLHGNIGFFGKLEDADEKHVFCGAFKEAIFQVIGNKGTLVVPTFSYSFCHNENFDIERTEGVGGIFAEYIRKDPQSIRSTDGNFSIAAIGKNASYFTENPPEHSFGKNSFWERLLEVNGKLCRFNLDPNFNTFIHYVEKKLNVDYRWDKKFTGELILNNQREFRCNSHYVRDLSNPNTVPNLTKLENKLAELKLIKTANLGRGNIVCILTSDVMKIVQQEITKNPNFLIRGKFMV